MCNKTGNIDDRSFERWSRSFKVTDFDVNGKRLYDFLLVNNTNSYPIPISRHFQDIAVYLAHFRFWDMGVSL